MANLAVLGDSKNHLNLQNLKKHFLFVKKIVNELLDDGDCFSDNPLVDIEAIALNVGIKKIERVPPEKVYDEHAHLEGKTILVNKEDSLEEQRFSIAHEIYHHLMNTNKTENEVPQAARSNLQYSIFKTQLKNNDKNIKQAIKAIGMLIYENIGKPISEITKYNILGKISISIFKVTEKNLTDKKTANKSISNFFDEIIKTINEEISKAIDEEIADYFAANLIVPTERYILWEDKTDDEVARAFGVNVGCIRKRRNEEIENELVFMVPQNQASSFAMEKESPLSLDELELALEGYNNYDTGRV